MSIYPSVQKEKGARRPKQACALTASVMGILSIALGILLILSLGSYSRDDAQWIAARNGAHAMAMDSVAMPPRNLVGRMGAIVASRLFWLLGATAYVLPFALAGWGARAIWRQHISVTVREVAGMVLIVLSLSGLLEFFLPGVPTWNTSAVTSNMLAGGILGHWIASTLVHQMAGVGSLVVLVAGFAVSLVMVMPAGVSAGLSSLGLLWQGCRTLGRKMLSYARAMESLIHHPQPVRPNKPVKINRASPLRGSVGSLPTEKSRAPKDAHRIDQENDPMEGHGEPMLDDPFAGSARETVSEHYRLPSPEDLLDSRKADSARQSDQHLEMQSQVLMQTLRNFGIEGKVTEIHPGPVITMYEFAPGPGIKVARIVSLADDLAMALKAHRVRVVAPLPKKSTVGIEVPNPVRETVSLKEMLTCEAFRRSRSKLSLALGQDILGRPVIVDLRTMPHLLVAGATGSGKSVGLNCILLNILFSAHPDEVKLLLIDPKVLELQVYDGIPHLLRPVITDPKSATRGLGWVVQEMERRYRLLAEHGVRNIDAYNRRIVERTVGGVDQNGSIGSSVHGSTTETQHTVNESVPGDGERNSLGSPLPYIVVIIDEFADLMMVAPKEVEDRIARLAQMARASGIHLVLATQRPSVDVVTGLIKANFPARIAYQVSSKIDSRTILDANGAETLLGRGDMLFMAPGSGRITRLHGPYVSDDEVRRVVEWVKRQASPTYDASLALEEQGLAQDDGDRDEVYEQARELVISTGQASASFLQRRLRVGYPRAARLIEQMEEEGLVSAPARDGRREVLVRREAVGEWSA
ncbi:MAG: DNA translocase FtsK [Nitrospirae bacterium]|nr:MAG: DNA translocase FtsK [Nitrospirota bacterium]